MERFGGFNTRLLLDPPMYRSDAATFLANAPYARVEQNLPQGTTDFSLMA
jgi:hypothetical protein